MMVMKKKAAKRRSAANSKLSSAEAETLSRLLTLERLKHAGVVNLSAGDDDPDLKQLVDAVREVKTKAKNAKKTPFTEDDLKKLAGF